MVLPTVTNADRWFLFCQQRRCGCRCRTDEVIFLHHSAGKNLGLDLFVVGIGKKGERVLLIKRFQKEDAKEVSDLIVITLRITNAL